MSSQSANTNMTKRVYKPRNTQQNQVDEQKEQQKSGRTLLVSGNLNQTVDNSLFSGLAGLVATHSTKNGSYFLTFDNAVSSLDGFNTLKTQDSLRVKYARYQVFFTVNGLVESSDYSTVKQELSSFVEKESEGSVLYFKLYRKDNKFIGCGDLTVDTKFAMDKLINKDSPLKNYKLGELSGTFYRYNRTGDNNASSRD